MGETADALRSDIESRREEMSQDIDELEQRARSLTDWRHQISERPMAALGVAAAGGLLLGILTGGSDDDERQEERHRYAGPMAFHQAPEFRNGQQPDGSNGGGMAGWVTGQRGPSQATDVGKDRAATKFDEIRGALMGLAAARAEEFLREAVPGFDHEVEKVQQNKHDDDQSATFQHDDSHSREMTGARRDDQA